MSLTPRILRTAACLGLLTLAACEDSTHDPVPPSATGAPSNAANAPPASVEDTSLPLVRRATLEEVEVQPAAVPKELVATFVDLCDDATRITGRLDTSSNYIQTGSFGWQFDSYVFTASQTGRVSIASEAPVNSYFYPFTVQTLQEGAEQPALSSDLVAGMPLPDSAAGDGKARVDISVEAGAQYLVTFKQLIGSASSKQPVDYSLSFCASSLQTEGKLWISNDESDVVRAEHVTRKLSTDTATPGVMGNVASALNLGK